jgi:TRAP-type mannitol/chloroaromatic compound transport system permease large subunit
VVKLYAGAFFPGIMLATLYIGYVIIVAKIKPELAPPMPDVDRLVKLTPPSEILAKYSQRALPGLLSVMKGRAASNMSLKELFKQFMIIIGPLVFFAIVMTSMYGVATKPVEVSSAVVEMVSDGGMMSLESEEDSSQPQADGVALPPGADDDAKPAKPAAAANMASTGVSEIPSGAAAAERAPVPLWYWITLGIGLLIGALFYYFLTMQRLEIFKMLLGSFFPLAALILVVLGAIVFGLATPTEAAALGSFGGFALAWAYKQLNMEVVKESVFLTAKTSAMVCWLFVGSSIFSAAFALLGGQELIEKWVLGLGLSKIEFLILSQVIIFLLGWPLEWTEIIVIFMPIFIPLLAHFQVDPLFFGLLVALNLQTAFLSPPVAMAAFYLKGVAPPHVTLNQIFAGMMPFMAIQVLALILLYVFPAIGMWLPSVLYS